MSYTCPLCNSYSTQFYNQEFQKCSVCTSIFRCKEYFLSAEKEKLRYESHNNDVEDSRYQIFVDPIVSQILKNHSTKEEWLDFWCGTGPVISHLLEQKWFQISLYDPFFYNNIETLNKKYDFIIACEVIEHFYTPHKEFQLLYNILKPNWKLYLMTDMYTPEIDFKSWYYKNDPTHVFFYSKQTFEWIKNRWKWKDYSRNERCIILEK